MSDFPEGIAAPEGAQKLVGVCKETWAVIQDESSEVPEHDEAVESFEDAMDELAELGVHIDNEGELPVFTLGVKETACDPPAPVAGAKFLNLPKTVALSTLTTAVDLSTYRTFKRCNLLVLYRAKGASVEAPSRLHKLCGKVGTHHTSGQHFCSAHNKRHSMRAHADGGKIFKTTSGIAVCCPKFGMALACPLPVAHIGGQPGGQLEVTLWRCHPWRCHSRCWRSGA
jgi:hypothetical protein